MATLKRYGLNLLATLRGLKPGQSVTFCIAGKGIETTYGSLHTAKATHQLPITIAKSDDGLTATVTRHDDNDVD
jgi:hypothetical protein